MSVQSDEAEWRKFEEDVRNSKECGAPSEAELVSRLEQLIASENYLALRFRHDAALAGRTTSGMVNSVWETASVHYMKNVELPNWDGVDGTDPHLLQPPRK